MIDLRRLILRHQVLFTGLMAFVLVMKLLVPAGFMPAFAQGHMTIEMCGGMGPQTMAMSGMTGAPGADPHDKNHAGKTETPCGFAGLSAPSLRGADPFMLAAAILLLVSTLFRVAESPAAAEPPYLRPHQRGPPEID